MAGRSASTTNGARAPGHIKPWPGRSSAVPNNHINHAKKGTGLGRGFDVLMPGGIDSSLLEQDKSRVQKLFISAISAHPDQPRKHFDPEALEQLAESIKLHG